MYKIRNWGKWQSWRGDRGQPPWIKIHRHILREPEWLCLSDAEKGQLISIWIVAADRDGEIVSDERILRKQCGLDDEINLQLFEELRFIVRQEEDTMASSCRQCDAKTSSRREEKRKEENRKEVIHGDFSGEKITPVAATKIPYSKIIDLYHEKLPMLPQVRKLTDTRKKYIKQRWLEDLPNLDEWRDYFTYVSQSKFLTGKVAGNNGSPPFEANLEWLCRPSNYTKVLERKYHR